MRASFKFGFRSNLLCGILVKMKKLVIFGLSLLLLFLSFEKVDASLVVVKENGSVVFNVLSERDDGVSLEIPKSSTLEVKNSLDFDQASDAQIYLTREGEKISLIVVSGDDKRELNVLNTQEGLVEIEERPEVKKVRIGIKDGKFSLEQRGLTAVTDYPISVDTKKAVISVTTESGDKYLSILPYEATQSFLRTKLVNWITAEKEISIVEEDQELSYVISGIKEIVVFDIPVYSIPITTKISATTGEVLSLVEPNWLKFLDIIFS